MGKVFAESLYKKRQIPRMGHFNSSEESVFFLRVAKNLSNPSNRHGVPGSFDQGFQAGCGQIIFDLAFGRRGIVRSTATIPEVLSNSYMNPYGVRITSLKLNLFFNLIQSKKTS